MFTLCDFVQRLISEKRASHIYTNVMVGCLMLLLVVVVVVGDVVMVVAGVVTFVLSHEMCRCVSSHCELYSLYLFYA